MHGYLVHFVFNAKVIFFQPMCHKTTHRFGFFNIRNNQGLGNGYQLQPSARLITLGITKTSSNNVLVIVINTLFELQMDKYPLLRDQVKKIVVQHGRKGEAKSKDQVMMYILQWCIFYIIRVTLEREIPRVW